MHKNSPEQPDPVDLFVCVSCRRASSDAEDIRPGLQLSQRLESLLEASPVLARLHKVDCMAVCKRVCTIAVSAPGKWTYIIGDLDAGADAEAIVEYVTAYAASPAGTPPLKHRPAAIRRGTVARLPARP